MLERDVHLAEHYIHPACEVVGHINFIHWHVTVVCALSLGAFAHKHGLHAVEADMLVAADLLRVEILLDEVLAEHLLNLFQPF